MQVNRMICQMKAENGLKRRGKFLETVFLMEILYFLKKVVYHKMIWHMAVRYHSIVKMKGLEKNYD